MSSDGGLRSSLEAVRRTPVDLAVVIGLTLVMVVVAVAPGLRETPLRIGLGLVFSLFLPGYAFVAALFPESSRSTRADRRQRERRDRRLLGYTRNIDGLERAVLSVGLSLVVLPLLGLLLNATPWGVQAGPILVAVGGFTVGCAIVAAVRRRQLPAERRFSVPYRDWIATTRSGLFGSTRRVDSVLNVLLVLALVLAIGSVGYVALVPQADEQYTEFYLATADDGELTVGEYPTTFQTNEGEPIVVNIANQEYETVTYTVVVQLEEADRATGERESVTELDRFETTLGHDETVRTERTIQPTAAGSDLRLTFLLYQSEPPADPTRENAYRETHLWIDVQEGAP